MENKIMNVINHENFLRELETEGNLEKMDRFMELLDKIGIEVRICTECKKFMRVGYCLVNQDYDTEYYCSDECLRKHYTEEKWNEIYDAGAGYWSEWYIEPETA